MEQSTTPSTPNPDAQQQAQAEAPNTAQPDQAQPQVQPNTSEGEATQGAVTQDAAQVDADINGTTDPEDNENALEGFREAAANLSPSEIPSSNEIPGILGVLLYHAQYGELPKPLDERNQ